MTTAAALLCGRYRLSARLATGGMADVWAAEDLRLEREVAVKLLRRYDPDAQRCFRRELGALSRMNHPAIVRLFDAGTHGRQPFMVIERIQGRSLRELLHAGPMPLERARVLGVNLADALAHAHDLGIVHRDVKPSNILIDELGLAHLADFGIAGPAASRDDDGLWGTAGYAAPEQLLGGTVDAAADVYALGLVLLEALTGRREYPGTPLAAAVARLRRVPAVPTDVPAPWPELLAAMTDRNPRRRPTSRTVAARLARAAGRDPGTAEPAAAPVGIAPPAAPPVAVPEAGAATVATAMRPGATTAASPRAIVLAGLAAVLTLALALPVDQPAAGGDLNARDEVAMVERVARSRADITGSGSAVSRGTSREAPAAAQAVIAGLRAGDTTRTSRFPTPLQH